MVQEGGVVLPVIYMIHTGSEDWRVCGGKQRNLSCRLSLPETRKESMRRSKNAVSTVECGLCKKKEMNYYAARR